MGSKHKKSRQQRRELKPRQAAAISNGVKLSTVGWVAPIVIALVTSVAFLPALQNGFVAFDDDKNFLLNQHYRGLGFEQLRWIFTAFHMGHYIPLTWLTLGLDYVLWGMNPVGYHLTNIILHAATAVAVYLLTVQLLSFAVASTGEKQTVWIGAAFAALFFSMHPLRVESVVWITERRDVLSGLFYMLSVLAYLKAIRITERRAKWYWTSVALFACALLSKSIAASLPVVLLILDVYPLKRLGGSVGWSSDGAMRVYKEKAPFVLLAGVASVIAFAAVSLAIHSLDAVSFADRITISGYSLGFYFWKTVAPFNLSPIYPLAIKSTAYVWGYILVGLVVMGLAFTLRQRLPALLAAWLVYVVVLLPVIGIVQNGPQITADRYTYLACLGWVILLGAGIFHCWRLSVRKRIGQGSFVFANGIAAVLVLGLGSLTWAQAQIWHDTETLFRHAIRVVPQSKIAHNNLGNVMMKRGDLEEAIEHYRKAIQIDPNFSDAHNNLGNAMLNRGEFGKAATQYREALRIKPDFADAHNNLGIALINQGESEEATKHYREALRIKPDFADAHNNLGNAMLNQGEQGEAIKHFRTALRINPDSVKAYNNLGNAMLNRGEQGEAIKYYRQALRINPDFMEAHYNLGYVMLNRGESREAIRQFREVLRINPAMAQAHNNLGVALLKEGKPTEATKHFCQALRLGYAAAEKYLTSTMSGNGKRQDASKRCREL